jgi:glucose-1-phosphatase
MRNIIFDLGGVLLNLDFERTFRAFDALGVKNFQQYFQQAYSNPLFARLETGACTPAEFYAGFRVETGLDISDAAIAEAWNAMLLDFREPALQFLEEIKKEYRIFLLSNTNQIHLDAFRGIHFRQFGEHDFDDYFEKAWYSHELGLRKPDAECFTEVLTRHKLNPAETLFVDDTLPNIEGAAKVGLQTCLLGPGEQIEQKVPGYLQ